MYGNYVVPQMGARKVVKRSKSHMGSGFLDDILGIDVKKTLSQAGQQAIDQAKTKVLSDVANSQQVQSAVASQGSQAAASALSQSILKNYKTIMLVGGIGAAGIILLLLMKRK